MTISQYRQGLERREFSVSEFIGQLFITIRKHDDNIGAFLEVFEEQACERARELDKRLGEETPPPLLGVPMAIKDNILIEGTRTTAASRMLEHYTASYDATVIRRLKENGAVFLGKTNLDEFAMGSSTENSAFKITRNPHDLGRVPGGSSGGSAAAVASGMALAALGSDTGGSIRQPAAFCGAVGFKPTYGAVSRYGLIALASSLDQIGPFATTVADAAAVFGVIAGRDERDATSIDVDVPELEWLHNPDVVKKIVGVPREYFVEGVAADVKREIEHVIDAFRKGGFGVREISLPHTKYALSCYYIILPAECSANLARYDDIRYSPLESVRQRHLSLSELYRQSRGEGLGDEPTRRILLGTFVLSAGYYDAYYAKAQKVRRLIFEDFEHAFGADGGGVDVILAPVTPTTAFGIGEKTDDPLSMYLSDIFTIPVNLAGLPALAVPVRSTYMEGELPVGFQLIGRRGQDRALFEVGHHYETALRQYLS